MMAEELSPITLLRPLCAEITNNLSSEQVTRKYVPKLIVNSILTLEEAEQCKTGSQLFHYLRRRSIDQVVIALNIIGEDSVNQGIRNKLDPLIIKFNLQEQFSWHSTPQLEQQSENAAAALLTDQPTKSEKTLNSKTMIKLFSFTGFVTFGIVLVSKTSSHTPQGSLQAPSTNIGHGNPFQGQHSVGIQSSENMSTSNLTEVHNLTETFVIPTLFPDEGDSNNGTNSATPESSSLHLKSFKQTLYEQLTALKISLVPPDMIVLHTDAVDSNNHFKSYLCNRRLKKALALTIETPFNPSQYQMPCGENVNGLILSGNMTIQNVHQILLDFPNIEFLVINATDMCHTVEYHWDELPEIELFEKLVLLKLKYLKVSYLDSDCSDLVQFLDEVPVFNNLETVVLDNVNVDVANAEWIENTISKHLKLQSFHLRGTMCPTCELFQKRAFNGTLKALGFTIQKDGQNVGIVSVKNLIANSAQSLKYFASNVELPRNRKIFEKLRNVQVMNITLLLGESVAQVSANFVSFFPDLNEISVDLHFRNKNVCKSLKDSVSITNLKKYVEPTRIWKMVIKANCRLVVVKGWDLNCRDYSFERLNGTQIVVLSATDFQSQCKNFWYSH